MKTKLQAGATLDLISKDELKDVLKTVRQDWFNQVARGDRYRRFSASGTIAGGALTIGGATQRDGTLGPAEGFVWALKRVAVFGLTTFTPGPPGSVFTEPLRLFLNDDGPSSLVHPAVQGYQSFQTDEVVMYPGDTLLVTGTSLVSTGVVTITGQARELPMPLAWRLAG